MKQIKLNSGVFLLVEVSETSYDVAIQGNTLTGAKKTGAILWFRDLPPGQWEIIGKASELSEEQWKDIVEYDYEMGFYKYYAISEHATHSANAKISGLSLLKSKNLKPETTIILKLKTNE